MTEVFGAYVHVPFCRHRCHYCAFATTTDRDHLMDAYVASCRIEVGRAWEREGLPPATTVYVGGGTPSRLDPAALCAVIEAVPRAAGAEVTVECNPEDVTADLLARYRSGGVTRISLGVQSTVPHVLEALGRRHGASSVAGATAAVAAAGFDSWNLDLIFGAVGERDLDWQHTLETVLHLPHPPPHVSAYALTPEPGTPLGADPARHPDDDVAAGRYETADAVLTAAGYQWEEISNWALPGHTCRHNALYWRQGDYRGIGAAAHSHRAGRRFWNVRTPERYIAAIDADARPVAGEEVLDSDTRAFERLALALRTPRGVPDSALPRVPELDGLVRRRGGRAVLTVQGRLLANLVTAHLDVRAQQVASWR